VTSNLCNKWVKIAILFQFGIKATLMLQDNRPSFPTCSFKWPKSQLRADWARLGRVEEIIDRFDELDTEGSRIEFFHRSVDF
jgi:hypothetical protein